MSTNAKIQPEANKKYRLITRSDMDGLVSAVLLKDLGGNYHIITKHDIIEAVSKMSN